MIYKNIINKFKSFPMSFLKNPLFSGSFVMIVGSNAANAIAYFYHLIIGRLLGPESYGELSAILSILGLLFTSFNFLGLVIVKFVSAAKKEEISFIFNWFSQRAYKLAIVGGLILILTNPLISNFLHLSWRTTILVAPIVFFAILSFVYRSFAQGLLKFWAVVVATNLDLMVRLIAGLVLIYLGFSVLGAVFGIFLSMVISFLFLRSNLKNYFTRTGVKDLKFGSKVFKYSAPLFISTLSTNSMIMTDVILVKHYFDPLNAGIYASISTLGKIIFYGTGPISAVMFPLISKRFSEKKGLGKVFFISFYLTLGISVWVLLIYYFFPDLAIKILFGEKYLMGSEYVFPFGVFITLFALSSLVFNYFLSIEKTIVVYISLIASVLQIGGILIWHSNINQVIQVSIFSMAFFLIALLIFYIYHTKNEKG